MEEDDLVVLSRDRSTWTDEQKKYHDNMPWLAWISQTYRCIGVENLRKM